MKTISTLILSATIALLGACATTLTPAQLHGMSDDDLCSRYSGAHAADLRDELNRRGAVRADNWATIDAKQIMVGFTEAELRCAWGDPIKINKTTTARGVHKQWVYGYYAAGAPKNYIYTNGRTVTAIQD